MRKCKYAGDPADNYCKDCNGLTMLVEGEELSCEKCAGYETNETAPEEEAASSEPIMNEPEVDTPKEEPKKETKKPTTKKTATKKTTAKKDEKPVDDTKKTKQVDTESKQIEVVEKSDNIDSGVKVVSIKYCSSATIKKDDDYYKFNAEEEWDVSNVQQKDLDSVRKQLWDTLNTQIDNQIEDVK